MRKKPVPKYDRSRNQYYARWRGKRYYLGTSEPDAYTRLAQIVNAVEALPDDGQPVSVAGACARWCSVNGGDWERRMLRLYVDFAGDMPLANVGHDHLHQLLRRLQTLTFRRHAARKPKPEKYGRKTLREVVRLAHAVLNWAHASGWIAAVPPKPDIPRPVLVPRDIRAEILDKAFAEMPDRALAVLRFIVATGCRPSEAIALRWEEVDLQQRVVTRATHKSDSSGKVRKIFLTDDAVALLEHQPSREGYVFTSRLHKPYTRAGLRAIAQRHGLPGTYCLRHTFAQTAANAGVQLDDIAALLGHGDLSTVQRYAQVRDERLKRVASTLPKVGHVPPQDAPERQGRRRRRKIAG